MQLNKIENKYLINVTQHEALSLIKSLTAQLMHNNSNVGRLESYTDNNEYFSVFVLSDDFKTTSEYQKWIDSGMEIIGVKGKP